MTDRHFLTTISDIFLKWNKYDFLKATLFKICLGLRKILLIRFHMRFCLILIFSKKILVLALIFLLKLYFRFVSVVLKLNSKNQKAKKGVPIRLFILDFCNQTESGSQLEINSYIILFHCLRDN